MSSEGDLRRLETAIAVAEETSEEYSEAADTNIILTSVGDCVNCEQTLVLVDDCLGSR